jgi:DNA (cytosine-5)-methyltransferase 1
MQLTRMSLQQLEQLTSQEQQEHEAETLSQAQSEQQKEVALPLYGKTLILRKLMPIEKERLMGFPEGWTDIDDMSDGKRGHGLGNSIVPQVAEEIFKRIKVINEKAIT